MRIFSKSLLALVLTFGIFIPTLGFAFEDVSTESSSYYPTKYLGQENIIDDTRAEFMGDRFLTRAELLKVTMISADIAYPNSVTDMPFPDLDANMWVTPMAAKAKELGIIRGYSDGTFGPDKPVTWIEALKIILNALTANSVPDASKDLYADAKSTDWWTGFIEYAITKNLIDEPVGSLFDISREFQRKKMAQIVYRKLLMDKYSEGEFTEELTEKEFGSSSSSSEESSSEDSSSEDSSSEDSSSEETSSEETSSEETSSEETSSEEISSEETSSEETSSEEVSSEETFKKRTL